MQQSAIIKETSHKLGWFLFGLTALFYYYDFILRMIPSVMMDNIITVYKIDATDFAILESSFYFMYTPLQLLAGPVVDEYGSRKIFPLAIMCCLIGSVLSALEFHFYLLIFARMLIGFGSAFAFIIVLKTASEWLPAYYYPFLSGLTTTLGMAGGITAEIVLPLLIHQGGQFLYLCSALFAVLLIIVSLLYMKDKEEHKEEDIDVQTILYDIYTLLSMRQLWIIGIVGCMLFAPIQIFITWAKSFYMQTIGIDETNAAIITSMLFWGVASGAPFNGWLASQTQNKNIIIRTGSLLALINMILIIFVENSGWYNAMLMFTLGLFVSSQCLVFVYAKNLVSPHLTATAVAATNMIVNLSSYIQPIIGKCLSYYHAQYEHGLSYYTVTNWRIALSIVPIMLFISFITSFFLDENEIPSKDTTE